MTHKRMLIMALALVALFAMTMVLPALASNNQPQATYQTPTPDQNGRILFEVQPGQTCLGISLLTGVPLATLRELNNLQGDCVLQPGQKLLLGQGGPSQTSTTPGPSPTPTALLPTPTLPKGTGEVCIALYADINGNAMREDNEGLIAGGEVSLTDRTGAFSKTVTTTSGTDPVCIQSVPEGDYNVSVAIPQGYNPTTAMNYALKVQAGDQSTLDFGAQASAAAQPVSPSEGGRSPIMGILGGILLLAGVALGLYVRQMRR